MAVPVLSRARRWAGLAVLVAAPPALADGPTPPAPAEVLHGTTKVTPGPADWEPVRPALPAPEPRVVPAGGVSADRPAPASLPVISPEPAEHTKAGTAPQTVVVIREPVAAAVSAPAPPQVVVVRETELRAEPAARTVADWALAGAVAAGLLVGAVVLRRPAGATVVVTPPAPAPAAPPVPSPPLPPEPAATPAEPEPPTIKIGGLDAGPLPSTAQKFDAGPTFQEERKAQERQEAEKGAAVLEFILGQNLALRAAPDDQ